MYTDDGIVSELREHAHQLMSHFWHDSIEASDSQTDPVVRSAVARGATCGTMAVVPSDPLESLQNVTATLP